LARLASCGAAGFLVTACSMSFPIAGFVADPTATGSIDRSAALMSRQLDQEDWRRAKAALAVALDPQGNGASVAWGNPRSGAKGSFVALAPPYTKADKVCRAFAAHIMPDAKSDRDLDGSACRGRDGEWVLADAKEIRKARS
jgi:surface antigen